MKRYKDATALRRALETRLTQESENTGGDLGRLCRRVVFDRLAVRLSVDDGTQSMVPRAGEHRRRAGRCSASVAGLDNQSR